MYEEKPWSLEDFIGMLNMGIIVANAEDCNLVKIPTEGAEELLKLVKNVKSFVNDPI